MMRFDLVPVFFAALAVLVWQGAAGAAEAVPNPAPLVENGVWAAVLKEHPRLLGPRERLVQRAAAMADNYAVARSGDSLLAAGIVHAVEGMESERIAPFIAKAKGRLAKGVTNLHQDTWLYLTEVAQVYDFFHDQIAPEDRQAMIEWLNAHLEAYTADENAFHNSTLSKVLCYLRVAYATWGENLRAKDFRDYALVKLYEGRLLPVIAEFGAGGGFTECGWYTRHSLWHLVEALELARRFEGYDGFAKAPAFFYSRLAYEIHQPYPGVWLYGSERYACEGDGSLVYGGHATYPRHMRTVLAQYFRGSELARYTAARARPPSNSLARLVDLLYLEEPDRPLELSSFPLAHLAAGIGKVYARGDWSDDASWLRFECGDYFVGHQHFEVGNFEIFRYEPLATESGEYVDYLSSHSVNWLIRTIAHNCILVHEPGETWSTMRDGGRNEYANDGGQTKKWEWTADNLDQWKAKRDTYERGDIIAYENRTEYMFVAGDCTAAYKPSKLSSWVRQILFIRPHAFVILDRVVSAKAEYAKTWLMHCRNEPDLSAPGFVVTDGKGSLHVRTLLPGNAVLRSVHGYTYGGAAFDERQSAQTAAAAKWRVEVTPSEPAAEDVFLHVIWAGEPGRTRLLEEDGAIALQVGDASIFFEGRAGGRIEIGGRTFALESEIKRGKYE